jgi:hypothetical protein
MVLFVATGNVEMALWLEADSDSGRKPNDCADGWASGVAVVGVVGRVMPAINNPAAAITALMEIVSMMMLFSIFPV